MTLSRTGAVSMLLGFEFDRDGNKATMTDPALGDHMLSEVSNIGHRSPQHRDLHAAIVIKVNVHCSDRQIVPLVGVVGQALR